MKESKIENDMMNKEILLKSGIIHDLRNLLMIMREVVEQIKSNPYDESMEMPNDEVLNKLSYISSLCDYCIYLTKVKDLFTKVDPNDSNNNGFEISETIKFCQNLFNERAMYDTNKNDLKVIYEEKDDKYPTIPMNRKIKTISEIQFKTVLINFLSNAYKYTDSGSIKIKTRIFNRKKEKKQKLRIMVEDTGTGFKGIKIEMNKPYHYHDKGKKNKEGSGFGLYMVAEILKSINSEIKYQTSEKGSMFYFDLMESCPFNEIIDLSKMYSSYLRQVIDEINEGKKDNVSFIGNNLDNRTEEEIQNKTRSPQINKHKYILYPHDNAIISLLGNNNNLSIIPENRIRKQTSLRKTLKKQVKSIFKIDKRKIQGLKSYNYNNAGNETFRDNQNIDAIGGVVQDIMEEEDNRTPFTVIICDDEGMICESIKRILKNVFESNKKFNDYCLNILIASDGIKCLSLVHEYVSKNKIIKFILMDNSMPYMDGITTCNIIKSSPVLNQTVYLLSGDDNHEDCKADGFFVKPLDEEDLKKILKKFY